MKFIKKFTKKHKVITVAIIIIVISTVLLSQAMNIAQAASDGKIIALKMFKNKEAERAMKKMKYKPSSVDMKKEEAINLAKENLSKLFGYTINQESKIETKFYREPDNSKLNGFWELGFKDIDKNFFCQIDSISKKLIVINLVDDKEDANYKGKYSEPRLEELTKNDLAKAKDILRSIANDEKYLNKAEEVLSKCANDNNKASLVATSTGILYKGYRVSMGVDKQNNKENFGYKDMPNDANNEDIVNLSFKSSDSTTYSFTFDIYSLKLLSFRVENTEK